MWRSKLGGEFPREDIEGLDTLHMKTLRILRAEPHNVRCADCGRADNTWASVNLGVFLCAPCADVHRGLGSHLSKVKNCTGLEWWGPDEISRMQELDLVLPNKQIHCGVEAGTAPSKHDLEQFCLQKYGMKTVVCKTTPASKTDTIAPSSGMKVAGGSRSDPFSKASMPVSGINLSLFSTGPHSQHDGLDHGKAKQALPKAACEIDFDDFFVDMELNTALAESQSCVGKSGHVDAIQSMPETIRLPMSDDKQSPGIEGSSNHDVFEVLLVAALPEPLLAPAVLKRMRTDEMWEHFGF